LGNNRISCSLLLLYTLCILYSRFY